MSYLGESWRRPLVPSGVMLRNGSFVLLTIFNLFYPVRLEHKIYSDGWIPMSHSDIYKQIRREKAYPIYLTTKPPIEYHYSNIIHSANTKKDYKDVKGNFDYLTENPAYTEESVEQIKKSEITVVNNKNLRNPKKVWTNDLNIDVENILPEIESKVNTTDNATSDVITAETSNIYEVTEDTDTSMTSEDNNTSEYIGYQYNQPTNVTQNLTSKFYEILSGYKINTNDKLQNYDLSLQRKVANPSDRVPLLYRYNSLNHLPVDPLLAVFLSNYGFYIPSLYGIRTNYNNLYGYLASNNIHNNKPFGLYKIFSDTDSWN